MGRRVEKKKRLELQVAARKPVLYYYVLVVVDTTLVVQYRITVLRYLGTWVLDYFSCAIIPGLALLVQ